jgi:hypothetical protein
MPNQCRPAPNADLCFGVSCAAPGECESAAGNCDPTTGLCGSAPPQPDGTLCSAGSCQAGVCTGRGWAVPRCCLNGAYSWHWVNPVTTASTHAYQLPLYETQTCALASPVLGLANASLPLACAMLPQACAVRRPSLTACPAASAPARPACAQVGRRMAVPRCCL